MNAPRLLLVLACVLMSPSAVRAGDEPDENSAAASELVERPKSVFHADLVDGRDPFFPRSNRRKPTVAPVRSYQAPAAPKPDMAQLSLRGILGSPGDRLALINHRILAEGETVVISVPGGAVKVRCVEIGENRVVVKIGENTERRELRLSSEP